MFNVISKVASLLSMLLTPSLPGSLDMLRCPEIVSNRKSFNLVQEYIVHTIVCHPLGSVMINTEKGMLFSTPHEVLGQPEGRQMASNIKTFSVTVTFQSIDFQKEDCVSALFVHTHTLQCTVHVRVCVLCIVCVCVELGNGDGVGQKSFNQQGIRKPH